MSQTHWVKVSKSYASQMKHQTTQMEEWKDSVRKREMVKEEGATSLWHHGKELWAQTSPGVILRERGGQAGRKNTHGTM